MKKLLFIAILTVACFAGADAQTSCPDGSVCLPQATVNKAAEIVDRYKAALATIDALQTQVAAQATSIKDRDAVIEQFHKLGVVNEQIIAAYVELNTVNQAALKTALDMTERLKKQLTGGKTKWQRILDVAKVLYYVLAGGAIVVGL